MTHPNPVVLGDDSGVPEVEQDFDAEIAAHTARLEAEYLKPLPAIISHDKDGWTVVDRERHDAFHAELDAARTPAEERTGADPWGNADCWCRNPARPHYRGTSGCIVAGMTPATVRTGVSDVQHAVAEEVEALRREIDTFSQTCAEYGRAQAAFGPGGVAREAAAARAVQAAGASMTARLDRIEQWTRGEQR